jgi:16S rRNA U516 pseudouridylate synthase RsuA-like enzyme
MCASAGLEVLTLKRVSVGAVRLGKLKTGEWRHLTAEEIDSLMKL